MVGVSFSTVVPEVSVTLFSLGSFPVAKAELVEQQKRDKAEENQFEDILAARTRIHSGTKDA